MTNPPETPQGALAIANRILAREGVLDAFGHISVRHPGDPTRFYLARSLAPELVSEHDILEFNTLSQPVNPFDGALYGERVIHGAIFRLRPDVNAICHHHSQELMPFCLTKLKLRVVTQLGATMGKQIPIWDQRDEFGATNHLVTNDEEAYSLARCLGPNAMVLMRRHGATVVGSNLQELVFRSVYSCRDAAIQLQALAHGETDSFTDAEIDLAGKYSDVTLTRAWTYWRCRLGAF